MGGAVGFHAVELVGIDGEEEVLDDDLAGTGGELQRQRRTRELEVALRRAAVDVVLDGDVPVRHLHLI